MENILNFVNIPKEARRKTKSQKEYYDLISNDQKHVHENVLKKPDISIVHKWKSQLSHDQILLYQRLNFSLLKKYDYEILNFHSSRLRQASLYLYYKFNLIIIYFRTFYLFIIRKKNIMLKIKSGLSEKKFLKNITS